MSLPASRSVRARRVSVAAIGLTIALALTGCGASAGASDDAAQTSGNTADLLPAAEGTTEYPLALDTVWGEITLDERPERIVAGDHWELDLLVALGVTPVGTNDQVGMREYALAQLDGEIESTWPIDDVWYPAEPIAATEPDLIVVLSDLAEPDNLAELSRVAPVLGAAPTDADTAPWEDRIRQLGTALDLSERAEAVIADNTTYFETVRAEHPEFAGKTAAVLHFWGSEAGGAYLSTPDSGPERFLTDLGFAPNPDAARFADVEDLSPELLGSIQADVILLTDASADPSAYADFVGSPLLQGLDAVKNGRLVEIETDNSGPVSSDGEVLVEDFGHFGWAIGGDTGPVPKKAIAEFLVPLLSGALAG